MIPIRDTAPSRYPAIMMWVLIGVNVVVFVFEASLGEPGIEQLFNWYGFVPAHLSVGINIQAGKTSRKLLRWDKGSVQPANSQLTPIEDGSVDGCQGRNSCKPG